MRKLVHGGQPEARRPRQSSLVPYVALLERRWAEGCRNGAQLWRETREAGFRGGQRVVTEWVARQRLASRPERAASVIAAPSRRRVALLLTGDPADWTSEERRYLERLFSLSPEIAVLHDLAQRFGRMVRQHGADDLTPWLAEVWRAISDPSPRGFARTLPPFGPLSPHPGATARPKARSPA